MHTKGLASETPPPRSQSASVGLGCRTGHRGPIQRASGGPPSFDASEGAPTRVVSVRAPSSEPRGRVLVLATNAAASDAIRRALEDEHDVVVCNDPIAALVGFVRGDEYDVVLCDSAFPYVPSGELRERVAAMNEAPSERILVLSLETIEPDALGSRMAAMLEISHVKDQIAELVHLRTLPPCAPFRAQR